MQLSLTSAAEQCFSQYYCADNIFQRYTKLGPGLKSVRAHSLLQGTMGVTHSRLKFVWLNWTFHFSKNLTKVTAKQQYVKYFFLETFLL